MRVRLSYPTELDYGILGNMTTIVHYDWCPDLEEVIIRYIIIPIIGFRDISTMLSKATLRELTKEIYHANTGG
jgi:hypothetical protein